MWQESVSAAAQMEQLTRAWSPTAPRRQVPGRLRAPRRGGGGGPAICPRPAPPPVVIPPAPDFAAQNRRASIIMFNQVYIAAYPVPDASLANRPDRQQMGRVYRGILAGAPIPDVTGTASANFGVTEVIASGETGVEGQAIVEFDVTQPDATGTTS